VKQYTTLLSHDPTTQHCIFNLVSSVVVTYFIQF